MGGEFRRTGESRRDWDVRIIFMLFVVDPAGAYYVPTQDIH